MQYFSFKTKYEYFTSDNIVIIALVKSWFRCFDWFESTLLACLDLQMQNDAQAKDAEVDECDIEDLLPTLVNVGDVPLVSELVVAQSPTEHVLDYGKSTMMKQVKKEYTVTTSRATFLLLVCIIINN